MKHARSSIFAATLLLSSLCLSVAADTDGFTRITPDQLNFKGTPGFSQAILYGDPAKPGFYVLRVKFGPGVHSNPHTHSQDRHVTVIKGVWWMGVGDTVDVAKAIPMKVGSYAIHPAGAAHYDGAGDEETIVQIMGMGPVDTVAVDSKAERTSVWKTPKVPN
jgi:quercetin dioxygenase-like cupin family protein